MRAPESPSVFVDTIEDYAVHAVQLEGTDETITSVTATTRIGRDVEYIPYYIKGMEEGREYRQLSWLRAHGIPVPEHVLANVDGTEFATNYAGTPLHLIANSPEAGQASLFGAGRILRAIHITLETDTIPENILARTYGTSSHIVDCFFYKYIGAGNGVTPENYRQHKQLVAQGDYPSALETPKINTSAPFLAESPDFHPALQGLVKQANDMASGFARQLSPFMGLRGSPGNSSLHISIPDPEICYGDFKPENILVDSVGGRIVVIDPILTMGSAYFDLAKFTSRYLLDGLGTDLATFFDGYGLQPTEELSYGPFSFSELIALDALNILRSYAKRYVAGDHAYRLTRRLGDPEFCQAFTDLLAKLSKVKQSGQLESLFL